MENDFGTLHGQADGILDAHLQRDDPHELHIDLLPGPDARASAHGVPGCLGPHDEGPHIRHAHGEGAP